MSITFNNIFNDDKFELIENPWTKEVDPNRKKFNFILEEGDYLAKTNNITIDSIKSMHKFESNKIYKLIYNINYIKRDFRIGFGDFGNCYNRLKEKGSVGLTNEGLFIEGEKRSNIKLNADNKEIIFIINLKGKEKKFELFIDGKSCGVFNFNLDKIYGIAAFYEGSVKINTFKTLY